MLPPQREDGVRRRRGGARSAVREVAGGRRRRAGRAPDERARGRRAADMACVPCQPDSERVVRRPRTDPRRCPGSSASGCRRSSSRWRRSLGRPTGSCRDRAPSRRRRAARRPPPPRRPAQRATPNTSVSWSATSEPSEPSAGGPGHPYKDRHVSSRAQVLFSDSMIASERGDARHTTSPLTITSGLGRPGWHEVPESTRKPVRR